MKEGYVTVFIPGRFRPCTGAHLRLIQAYSMDPRVEEVRVLVCTGSRDGINQSKAVSILERLTAGMNKISIEPVKWPSALVAALETILGSSPGQYAIGSSERGQDRDMVNRFISDFYELHLGDLEKNSIELVELPVDIEVMKFVGRDDEHEGQPVSASVLRDDIVNDDFDNFVSGYRDCDPDDIEWVWNEIASLVMNESQFGTGPSTKPSFGNYDSSWPGYHYKNSFPIMEEDDDIEDISEESLVDQAAYPWEYYDITFGELRAIIEKALSGGLENVTEKLDGQNIMITVKGEDVYLARTDKQMKNRGELATKWNDVYDYFGEKIPEKMKLAYKTAIKDIQKVLERSSIDLEKVFKKGYRWLDIDLLNPDLDNVVPYEEFQLCIHGLREVDKNGRTIEIITNGKELDEIILEIERVQRIKDFDNIHFVEKAKPIVFNEKEEESRKHLLLKELDDLITKWSLDDKNNIADYITEGLRKKLEIFSHDEELNSKFLNKWIHGNMINLSQETKGTGDNIVKKIKTLDANIDEEIGDLLEPIVEIFSKLGTAVLKNLSGIAASNPDLVSYKMRLRAEDAISKIESYINKNSDTDQEGFEKNVRYIEKQLQRLESLGGLDAMAPTEGVVFQHNKKFLKLTGAYMPVAAITDFLKFVSEK